MGFRDRTKLNWLAMMIAIIACTGLVEVGFAQSTNSGDIRGIVTDASGAVLPDVTVTVVNTNTGVTKTLTTNQDGLYDTSSIVAGTYEVTFSKAGFSKFVRSSISLQVGLTTLNAQLNVGSVTESVVVNTDIPLLKTENGEQTTTLEAKEMSQSSRGRAELGELRHSAAWQPGCSFAAERRTRCGTGCIGQRQSSLQQRPCRRCNLDVVP